MIGLLDDFMVRAALAGAGVALAAALVERLGLPVDRALFAFRTDDQVAQFALIRSGCGIGICQAGLARRHGLTRLLREQVEIPLETWIVTHEDLKSDRRIRVVFDALHGGLSAYAAEG